MEASANVETESVSFTDDKESDKISDAIRMDDDNEVSKIDVDESFELINNEDVGDTDKTDDGKNITNESVSTSKDIISLESNVSFDTSDNVVENTVSNNEGIETGQPSNTNADDAEQLIVSVNADEENLMDEIHCGDFNATSSPVRKSTGHLNTSLQSVDDSFEMVLENDAIEEEIEEEHDIEEEEENDHRINAANNVNEDAIEIIDDDDDEEDVDDDSEDNDVEDSSDNEESLDNSDRDENNDYDHKDDDEDDDISTLSSDGGEDIEADIVATKEPLRKRKATPRKKYEATNYKNLVKKSIKILTSLRSKRTMLLKPSNAISAATEHPNGNQETICREKTKETEKMVQMFSNESPEEVDDDDVCLIDDSPIKVNGKHETEDIGTVEQNIKIEQMEQDENVVSAKIEKIEDVEMEQMPVQNETVQINGIEGESNQSNTPSTESIVSVPEQVPKPTESISEESVPTVQSVVEKPIEAVSNTKPNYKRARSASPVEDVQPTKRLKTELEQNYIGHNKRVQEYIDKTANNSIDEINNHVRSLLSEVQELHALAAAKEQEWNNILYLKNVKEEIICRLTRRKSVMEISSAKVGEVEDYTILEQQPSISQKITKENRNSTNMNHNQHSYLRNLSTTEAAKLINNRADMSTSDLDEQRVTSAKMHRNILPKTELAGRSSSPNINHLSSLASANMQQHIQQQQQKAQQQFIEQQHQIFQQTEHLNGNHQVGRQGPIKDVKSIIEAFRQKNPERAPRRGRRLKPVCSSDGRVTSPRSTDGILTRQSVEGRVSELGLLLAKDINSRPSSADSSPGNSNLASTNNNISTANANISFNDMLLQYAKMNERPSEMLSNASMVRQQSGYPEVTLHPVNSQPNTIHHQSDNLQSNSLLHGILTKQNTRPSSAYNSFSPTLARLLTAPERITTLPNNYRLPPSTPVPSKTSGVNLTKPRNEITITPVMSNAALHQTILQQQLQRQQDSAARMKFPSMDDEADDSADRLVIDEGDIHNEQSAATAGGREFPENEFPKCQGCKKHEAQFVCAGCENQWYCSRICQVSAWGEHCELCTG